MRVGVPIINNLDGSMSTGTETRLPFDNLAKGGSFPFHGSDHGEVNFVQRNTFFTKHFAPSYHQQICPTYILKNHHVTTELQREGVLIYQDITPWGGQYSNP